MKLFKPILFTLFCVTLCGCIGDDYDDCAGRYTLCFDYPAFPDHIRKVNVGIFDADGLLVTSREVDQHQLSLFAGVALNLESGNYTAICWGNVFDHTHLEGFSGGRLLHEGRVSHPRHLDSGQALTHDSLYYGKLAITIPEDRPVQEDTVRFVPAHIKLQIQVKGLSNTAESIPAADYPFIRVNNLLPVYDFHMQPQGSPLCYYPRMRVTPAEKLATTRLDVLRFDNSTPATIDVVENANTHHILYTLSLREFMLANSIDIVHGQEVTIPILIAFHGADVTVSLMGWGGTPTEPEI